MLFQKIDTKLLKSLYMTGCDIKTEETLSSFTSAGIGGTVALMVSPYDMNGIGEIFRLLEAHGVESKLLGRGTNVIASDGRLNFTVLETSGLNGLHFDGNTVYAECGCSLRKLSFAAADRGLTGLEPLSGIPGSVGGAIRMNAGAYGREIFDFVQNVEVYDKAYHKSFRLSAAECGADYRKTVFKSDANLMITAATLRLHGSSKQKVIDEMSEYSARRAEKQPIERKSAGSVFKKPSPDFHVGKVIEELGMKGMRLGGAEISEKHSGFIINTGNSTCEDFTKLIKIITDRVHEKTGIILETEIEFWK